MKFCLNISPELLSVLVAGDISTPSLQSGDESVELTVATNCRFWLMLRFIACVCRRYITVNCWFNPGNKYKFCRFNCYAVLHELLYPPDGGGSGAAVFEQDRLR